MNELPQVSKNLRFRLLQESKDTAQWDYLASDRLGIPFFRVRQIISGEEIPSPKEIERIAHWCGKTTDDICSAPIYPSDADGMKKENLRFLLKSLEHGEKRKVAKTLGVTAEQLSRWSSGNQSPNKNNVRRLLRYFRIDPALDLEKEPLFLSNYPVHAAAKKSWLLNRLQEMPPEKLDPHFNSIRKLLTPE